MAFHGFHGFHGLPRLPWPSTAFHGLPWLPWHMLSRRGERHRPQRLANRASPMLYTRTRTRNSCHLWSIGLLEHLELTWGLGCPGMPAPAR